MSTFDEREQAFEAKFQHDEELQFKVLARRSRLLGLWAAHLMEMHGDEAEAYARTLVDGELTPGSDQALITRVCSDLERAGIDISRHRVERHAADCLVEARRQYMTA
ncbi:DUF1476 domain-containing protein [Arenibaculum pallidiluteum]|uniref:DUF1476 domain-containing protein n=1 Tax=Arenibaculum pallidiluteum TaxID=2812559 RepID=UPI001A9660CA|nr:DUF1476 domain-containing protein [Arenibaculum pallidiluteum]